MDRALKPSDEPLDRLFKLLPAESTSAFLLLRAMFPYDASNEFAAHDTVIFYSLSLIIFLATPFLLVRIWLISERWAVIFISASFLIWAANIDIDRLSALSEYLATEYHASFKLLLSTQLFRGLLVVWAIVLIPLVIPKKAGG